MSDDPILAALAAALDADLRRIAKAYMNLRGGGCRIYPMLARYGSVETARKLVENSSADGLAFLKARGAITMTAEWIVLDPRYHCLFSKELLQQAYRTVT